MDKITLVKNLHTFFCELGNEGRNYSAAWLEEMNYGGLYRSRKFRLNVRTDRQVDNPGNEMKDIVFLLFNKAKTEYDLISVVKVHNLNDAIHHDKDDLIVFESTPAC